jgi:hypothetical protein
MKNKNYWVKIRYEQEVRVHVPSEQVAKDHAMERFIAGLPGISAKDLRIMYIETSEDRK